MFLSVITVNLHWANSNEIIGYLKDHVNGGMYLSFSNSKIMSYRTYVFKWFRILHENTTLQKYTFNPLIPEYIFSGSVIDGKINV